MKKILLKLIAAVCFICCFGMTSYAYDTLHICERFDIPDFKAYEYWERKAHWYGTPEHYVRVENDELVLSLGAYVKSENDDRSSESWATLTLPNAVSTGKVRISFDVKLNEAGNLISYHGIGSLCSTDGLRSKGICTGSRGIIYCGNDSTNLFSRDVLMNNIYHTVRIELDLDKKIYDIYIDDVIYCDDEKYIGEDLYKIDFDAAPGGDYGYKVYLDNVEVYDETKYIFVSGKDGNDENSGSVEEPVESIDRALEMYSEYDNAKIYILSGEYNLPEGFTYNNGDIVNAMNNIVIYPYYRQEVYFNDTELDLPELKNISAPQEFKDKFISDTNRYIGHFPYEKFKYDNFYITYDYDLDYIKYGFEISDGGYVSADVKVIAAIYSFGKLIDCIAEDVNIKAGQKTELDFEFGTDIEYNTLCRIFIWDEESLRPIGEKIFSDVVPGEKSVINQLPEFLEVYKEDIITQENTILIPGVSACDAYVTVKVVDENGKNVAINQYEVSAGAFEIEVRSKYSLPETNLYIQGVAKQ